jgi:hypothetical protein
MMMKALGLILWLAVAMSASAQTNRFDIYRFPTRVLGPGTVVNLQPLYDWWGRQPKHEKGGEYENANINIDTNNPTPAGMDRPLSAWHLVTGTHVSTMGSSWVVNAVIFTSPNARTNTRIILNHPPIAEEQQYYSLKNGIQQATLQITNDARAYTADTKAEQDDQKKENSAKRSRNRRTENSANNYAQLANQNQTDAANAASQEKDLETARTQAEEEIKSIPAVNGVYYVDWFAAVIGYSKQGLPIYDMGRVAASAP